MDKGQSSRIESAEELAGALRIAAELEHGLCCQYLFAAFTLRRTLEDFAGVSAGEDAKRHVMALPGLGDADPHRRPPEDGASRDRDQP